MVRLPDLYRRAGNALAMDVDHPPGDGERHARVTGGTQRRRGGRAFLVEGPHLDVGGWLSFGLRVHPGVQRLRFAPSSRNHQHACGQALSQNVPTRPLTAWHRGNLRRIAG